jgi:hypothetical protein
MNSLINLTLTHDHVDIRDSNRQQHRYPLEPDVITVIRLDDLALEIRLMDQERSSYA